MINFDSLTLKALILELEPILLSGRVQKVHQPSKNELLLNIRSLGKNFKLYICIDPKYPHIAIMSEQGEKYRDIEIPQKPPMFCMLLRKHMEGTKILDLRQPDYERIFEIYFESYNELGAKIPMVLACELMGKYSNFVLYNYETNVILGCGHPVGPEKSREREIAGGLPYIYPPKPKKNDLLNISEDQFLLAASNIKNPINAWLNQNFYHISFALANEVCAYCEISLEKNDIAITSQDKIKKLYKIFIEILNLNNLNPSISRDKKLFSLIGLDSEIYRNKASSVNSMVDLYYGYQVFKDKFSRLKTSLSSLISKELKKQLSKIEQHSKKVLDESKAEKYRETADILIANTGKVKLGMDSIELENFYNNNKLEKIQLDPTKNVSANAQKFYKLYNKGKMAAKVSIDIMKEAQSEVEYIESIIMSLNQAESLDELRQIKEELAAQKIIKIAQPKTKGKEKQKKEHLFIKEFESSDGFKIYLGKNNKQNEHIISKIAHSNDIWLHTHNIPGSHVLVKIPGEIREISDNALFEAANIAAYYSQAKDSVKIPVIYTKRKYLKKPPGSKPGYITYSNEKTVFITPDENLIRNLTLDDLK